MKSKRREFLKSSFLLGSSAFWLSMAEKPQAKSLDNKSSWEEIRDQFIVESDYSYLNNATMGISPKQVIETTYEKIKLADSTGKYGGGDTLLLDKLGAFLSVPRTSLALTRNVTEGANMVLMSFPLRKRDEVICTNHEHAGTAIPLIYRSQRDGFKLTVAPIDISTQKTTENILNAITKRTKLICIPHMPCTNGQVLEVKKLCAEAKKRGIYTFIDGAHPPGMLNFTISELDCDFYSGCGHKWMLGPKGTGFVYVRSGLEKMLPPIFVGAGSYGHFELSTENQVIGKKVKGINGYFYGSHNAALFYGLASSIDFLNTIGMERVEHRVKQLSYQMKTALKDEFNNISFLCPETSENRSGVVCFKFLNKDSKELFSKLMQKKVRTRHIYEGNLDALRVSNHIYNNENDLDRLIDSLKLFVR